MIYKLSEFYAVTQRKVNQFGIILHGKTHHSSILGIGAWAVAELLGFKIVLPVPRQKINQKAMILPGLNIPRNYILKMVDKKYEI